MTIPLRTMPVVTAILVMLVLGGCAPFLRPDPGMLANKEGRIALADQLVPGVWETGELRVNYSLIAKDGSCALEGRIVIANSIANSFPIITRLFFYLSFLDDHGRVVETVDISPVIPTFGSIPASLPLRMTHPRPPEAKFVVFHYHGGFRSNPQSEGGHWDINHFPFVR